ncbi:hypothetical protein PG994_008542 [Apiospora phragmitis]|uniref:F-box domain-containing protein n=1 Tax=Apiospora phragmitis TaxID=2905665 RepID=A0ABR1UGS1_9PEZI
MASNTSYDAEMLISRLGHIPNPMAKDRTPATDGVSLQARKEPLRPRDKSSLGRLDRLPPELTFMVIKLLDLQSITRLQRVSYQGDAYVHSCVEYRDLCTNVPRALEAFGLLNVGRPHLVAIRYYGLSEEQCRQLPVVRLGGRKPRITIGGTGGLMMHPNNLKAVSAKAARDLAIAVHGSEEALAKATEKPWVGRDPPVWWYWQTAHRVPPRQDWLAPSHHRRALPRPAAGFDARKYASMTAVIFLRSPSPGSSKDVCGAGAARITRSGWSADSG